MNTTAPRYAPPQRRLFIWIMMVAVLAAGAAFTLKIAQFLHTLESPDVEGFITVPITTYFAVAMGYLFLFGWCWAKGDFKRIEEPKFTMLEREMEYDELESDNVGS